MAEPIKRNAGGQTILGTGYSHHLQPSAQSLRRRGAAATAHNLHNQPVRVFLPHAAQGAAPSVSNIRGSHQAGESIDEIIEQNPSRPKPRSLLLQPRI